MISSKFHMSTARIARWFLVLFVLVAFSANFSSNMYKAFSHGDYNPTELRDGNIILESVDPTKPGIVSYHYPDQKDSEITAIDKDDQRDLNKFLKIFTEFTIRANITPEAVRDTPFVNIAYKAKTPDLDVYLLIIGLFIALIHGIYLFCLASFMYLDRPQNVPEKTYFIGILVLCICYCIGFLLLSGLRFQLYWPNINNFVLNNATLENLVFIIFYAVWFLIDYRRANPKNWRNSYNNEEHHKFWYRVDAFMASVLIVFTFFVHIDFKWFTIKDVVVFLTLIFWGYRFLREVGELSKSDDYIANYLDYLKACEINGKIEPPNSLVVDLIASMPDPICILDYGAGNGKRLKEFVDVALPGRRIKIFGCDMRPEWGTEWENMMSEYSGKWLGEPPRKEAFDKYHIIHASNVTYSKKARKTIINKFKKSKNEYKLLVIRGYQIKSIFYYVGVSANLFENYLWQKLVIEEAKKAGLSCISCAEIPQVLNLEKIEGSSADVKIGRVGKMIEKIVQTPSARTHAIPILKNITNSLYQEFFRDETEQKMTDKEKNYNLPNNELYLYLK